MNLPHPRIAANKALKGLAAPLILLVIGDATGCSGHAGIRSWNEYVFVAGVLALFSVYVLTFIISDFNEATAKGIDNELSRIRERVDEVAADVEQLRHQPKPYDPSKDIAWIQSELARVLDRLPRPEDPPEPGRRIILR